MLLRPVLAAAVLLAPLTAGATFVPHIVTSSQKISDTAGDLSDPNNPGTNPGGYLADGDRFGYAAPLGDFDGDGVADLAVGARFEAAGGMVHLLLLNADGTVKQRVRIGDGDGVPPLALTPEDHFGAVTNLGDVDGDGTDDLAVGAAFDNTGGADAGAVYILFLNADGTLRTHQKITEGVGGGPTLAPSDYFGMDVAGLGDLDGDGIPDLAVGASADDISGDGDGALYIYFLKGGIGEPNPGTVKSTVKIGAGSNGFVGPVLGFKASFGSRLALLGDLDGDQRPELAVGSERSDQSGLGADTGSVWILSLRSAAAGDAAPDIGKVSSEANINNASPGFPSPNLQAGDRLGQGLGALGDYDGDGVADLAVMSSAFAIHPLAHGAVHLLYLNADKTVKAWDLFSEARGCFPGGLSEGAGFGWGGMAALGDLSDDGTKELAVGAFGEDDGGTDRGAVYVLSLEQPVNPGPDHQLVCASLDLELFADFPAPPTTTVRQGVSPLNAVVGPAGEVSVPGVILGPAPPGSIGGYPFTFFALSNLDLAPSPLPTQFVPEAGCGDLSWPDPYGPNPPIAEIGGGFGGHGSFLGKLEFTPSLKPYVPGGYAFSACQSAYALSYGNVRVAGLPWTTGTAKVNFRGAPWTGSPTATTTRQGFDLRTASSAGHMSVVTPVAIQWDLGAGGPDIPSFARLNLTFVPEPAPLLGLAAGAVFLAVVVRRRLRR